MLCMTQFLRCMGAEVGHGARTRTARLCACLTMVGMARAWPFFAAMAMRFVVGVHAAVPAMECWCLYQAMPCSSYACTDALQSMLVNVRGHCRRTDSVVACTAVSGNCVGGHELEAADAACLEIGETAGKGSETQRS